MSLLHKPKYTSNYDEHDDSEGLNKLLWSQFMCKCGRCDVSSGKRLMEKIPVIILDQIAQEERIRLDIELAYVCKIGADEMPLTSMNSHRAGLAVRIRVLNPKKRMLIIRGLIVRGVTRIALNDKYIYFDVDDLKQLAFYYR
jgi:hypothetical protein